MTRLEFYVSDEKALALIRASRLFDEGIIPNKWKSVKDNPPGMAYRLVYVFTTNTIEIAKYKGTLWRTRDRRVIHSDEVKYWAHLPEPPKEDEHDQPNPLQPAN